MTSVVRLSAQTVGVLRHRMLHPYFPKNPFTNKTHTYQEGRELP